MQLESIMERLKVICDFLYCFLIICGISWSWWRHYKTPLSESVQLVWGKSLIACFLSHVGTWHFDLTVIANSIILWSRVQREPSANDIVFASANISFPACFSGRDTRECKYKLWMVWKLSGSLAMPGRSSVINLILKVTIPVTHVLISLWTWRSSHVSLRWPFLHIYQILFICVKSIITKVTVL